jgi:hypothetical protein
MKDKSLGADGKPKYFYSEAKAVAFIGRKGLGETHYAKQDDDLKWEILPKETSDDS